ncbi:unnamed protein product, partial [Meganyctiphanes norvegica]
RSIKHDRTGKNYKSENIELVDIHQQKDKTNKESINKKEKKKGKLKDKESLNSEILKLDSKCISKERLIETHEHEKHMQESENEDESANDISSQANEVNEATSENCEESPTTSYLRDVAVPKTKKNKKKLWRYRDSG